MDETPETTSVRDGDERAAVTPGAVLDSPIERSSGSEGELPVADTKLRRYGPTLYTLAYVLTEDRGRAEQLVLRAIFTTPAESSPPEPEESHRVLRDLARLIYLHWAADTEAKSLPPHPSSVLGNSRVLALCAALKSMPHEHRVALALCTYGGHSCRQTAGLLKMPTACVAELLLEAPHELEMAGEDWEAVNAAGAGTGRTTSTGDC